MSTAPTPMPRRMTPTSEEQQRARAKAERRSDLLYFTGAGLVTIGVAFYSWHLGLVVAGGFLLLMPLLEIAASFVKGIRPPRSR